MHAGRCFFYKPLHLLPIYYVFLEISNFITSASLVISISPSASRWEWECGTRPVYILLIILIYTVHLLWKDFLLSGCVDVTMIWSNIPFPDTQWELEPAANNMSILYYIELLHVMVIQLGTLMPISTTIIMMVTMKYREVVSRLLTCVTACIHTHIHA